MCLQVARTLDEHISQYCQVVLETCAYAGTGDVLKVQQMLGTAGEHIETEDSTAWKVRSASTLGNSSRMYQRTEMVDLDLSGNFWARCRISWQDRGV